MVLLVDAACLRKRCIRQPGNHTHRFHKFIGHVVTLLEVFSAFDLETAVDRFRCLKVRARPIVVCTLKRESNGLPLHYLHEKPVTISQWAA